MEEFLLSLVGSHPKVVLVLSLVGALRLVLKPAFSLAYVVVKNIPGLEQYEDEVSAVENSKFVKGLLYVLDWFASVKLLPPAK